MDCPGCGTPLLRWLRDRNDRDPNTNDVVQVCDKTKPETELEFTREGFWAASIADAETFTYARDLPIHSILSPEGLQIVGGTHNSVLT